MPLFSPLQNIFQRRLWQEEPEGRLPFAAVKALRLLILAAQGLWQNRSLVRAASLAYATILALIPMLALLFAVWKGLGLQRLLAANLLERLAPGSQEFAMQIFQYIENTRVATLGVFGVVALLAVLVVVMTNVERAFNETWHVSHTRPLSRKLSDYLSIFLVFPLLMAGTISVFSAFLGHPEIRRLLEGLLPAPFYTATSGLVHLGLLWIGFTFIYLVMPNTTVRFRSALLGGVVGGSLWQAAQWVFIWFQGMATYYNAIYGALYHLLFLFVWMFWSWLIVLFGTEVAYAHQYLGRLSRRYRQAPAAAEPLDEYLGLAALIGISARFYHRQPPLSLNDLGEILPGADNLPARAVALLKNCRLVVEVSGDRPGASPRFLPSLPLDQITVKDVLGCLRLARSTALVQALEGEPQLSALLKGLLETAAPSPWQDLTLQDLVKLLEAARNEAGAQEGERGAPGPDLPPKPPQASSKT
jgi:membrane protein